MCGLSGLSAAAERSDSRREIQRLEQENARKSTRIAQLEKQLADAGRFHPAAAARSGVALLQKCWRWLMGLLRKIDLYLRDCSDHVPFLKRLRDAYFASREKGDTYYDVIAAAQKSINPTNKEYKNVADLAQDYNKNMNAALSRNDTVFSAVDKQYDPRSNGTVKYIEQHKLIDKEMFKNESQSDPKMNRW